MENFQQGMKLDYISICQTNPSLREYVQDTRKATKQRRGRPGELFGGVSKAEIRAFGGQRKSLALAHTAIRASPCSPIWWATLQLSAPRQARNLAARNQSDGTSKKTQGLPRPSHWPELWNVSPLS